MSTTEMDVYLRQLTAMLEAETSDMARDVDAAIDQIPVSRYARLIRELLFLYDVVMEQWNFAESQLEDCRSRAGE